MDGFEDIHGGVAIEFGELRYIHAMDNGLFTLGESRERGRHTQQLLSFEDLV